MNRYEVYEIDRAIRSQNGTYKARDRNPETFRSSSRRWNYVVRAVCSGCGKTLNQYEVRSRLAYCFSCRRILFPEPIHAYESPRKRRPYTSSRGHSW